MLNKLRLRLRALFFKSRLEEELDEEVRFHLEREVEENIARGMTPEEARYAALRSFGGVERVKEESRDVRGIRLLEEVWQDLSYGARMLMKNPGFTTIAVITLALGIGANTAIFSLVNAILLRPLPVDKPDDLVMVLTNRATSANFNFSYPLYADFRDHQTSFSGLIAHAPISASLSEGGLTERVKGEIVSGNYFDVLGLKASAGRTFTPEEDQTLGRYPVVVLSYGLWRRRFGGDPGVVGQTVRLNGSDFTVVGVAPKKFSGMNLGEAADIWVPIMTQPQSLAGISDLNSRGVSWLYIVGRLKPGLSVEQARLGLDTLFQRIKQVNPLPDELSIAVRSGRQGQSDLPEAMSHPLLLLMSAVGLILLIACANIANLLLSRASVRRREIGVRLALGASRSRLIRQLLTESVVLAVFGGFVGASIAFITSDVVLAYIPTEGAKPVELDVSLDATALAFTLILSILTGLICGLAPAFQSTKPNLISALKEEMDRFGRGRRVVGIRNILVIAQVALSLVLLIAAGLLLRTLQKLRGLDLGFAAKSDAVLLMTVDLKPPGYDRIRGREFYRQLAERLDGVPGVRSISWAAVPPVNEGGSRTSVFIKGYQPQNNEGMEINFNTVGLNYFGTLGIPLLKGRDFNSQDVPGASRVVIVNETMARRYWPDQDAVGKQINLGDERGPSLEIIGIAKDGKYRSMREAPRPSFYLPLTLRYSHEMTLHLAATTDPRTLIPVIRREVRALDPELPILNFKTLSNQIDNAMVRERMAATLCGVLAFLALLLAATGVYGVMAYAVSTRVREIGIRMALGAKPLEVLTQIVGESMVTVGVGIALGLVAAFYSTGVLSSLLYGVNPADPATFAGIAVLLMLVALAASYVPARRASKVDPMVALRFE